ncbi:macrolide transporter subunit MacA [Planctomycetes bacterium Poly30]|uniref:Macrolide transporter subunit MacA n=1 Tax=Saltatorellus ferox TaxID=2528018 RepID=A0A518EKU5_9BACT|nr:macrolide transporter subunit MacA [Planctomycetes bacterium Poly30]
MKILLAVCPWMLLACSAEESSGPTLHTIERGSVTQEAVAIGKIMPRVRVPIHSPWSGVVTERPVQLGSRVAAKDPLIEVRPQLTDRDRLMARRSLAGAEEGLEAAVELSEGQNLLGQAMRIVQGKPQLTRLQAQAERSRRATQVELELLLNGEAEDEGLTLDWFVRAPISGTVVELPVELGEPITPASNFGPGSLLMTIADLDHLVMRATVDELDAGRLVPEMQARIELGALPGVLLKGSLREISLIAGEKNGASVFDVTLDVTPTEEATLRAGYSAVARITVAQALDVPVVPERYVEYSSGPEGLTASVQVTSEDGTPRSQIIRTGVSDGLVVEIVSGLAVGDRILVP